MTNAPGIFIQGAPGSPYTRKMLALLRYRHIPYRYINRAQAEAASMPRPKVELLPTLYFPGDGGYTAAVDSTPLIRRLELAYPQRSVLPPDPLLAFLDLLIEDYADEWLTKCMFHYRWHFAPDREKAGTILPAHMAITAPSETLAHMKQVFTDRQFGRLRYVGSNPTTAPVTEASYLRFIKLFDELLTHRPYVFGARPSAADFAIYGQLTQLALFDPTSAALTLAHAPRVAAWVELLEDASGVADDAAWAGAADAAVLAPLLAEIGRVYAPVLLANEAAMADGAPMVTTRVDGQPWEMTPFPYHLKCLAALRAAQLALPQAARNSAGRLLEDAGLTGLFSV